MPTYVYRCPKDNSEQTAIKSIMDRNTSPACKECGGYMQKIFTPATTVIIK